MKLANGESEEDFLRMQQEAINRVRVMQARARQTLENNGMHIQNQRYGNSQRETENGVVGETNDYHYTTSENVTPQYMNGKAVSQSNHYIPNTPEIGNTKVSNNTLNQNGVSDVQHFDRMGSYSQALPIRNNYPHPSQNPLSNSDLSYRNNFSNNEAPKARNNVGNVNSMPRQSLNQPNSSNPVEHKNNAFGNNFNNRPVNVVPNSNNQQQNRPVNQNENTSLNQRQDTDQKEKNMNDFGDNKKPPKNDGGLSDLLNIPLSGLNINIDKDQLILLGTLYALFKDGGDNWLMMAVAYILFT